MHQDFDLSSGFQKPIQQPVFPASLLRVDNRSINHATATITKTPPAKDGINHLALFFPAGSFSLPCICSLFGTTNPGLANAKTSMPSSTFLNSKAPKETSRKFVLFLI